MEYSSLSRFPVWFHFWEEMPPLLVPVRHQHKPQTLQDAILPCVSISLSLCPQGACSDSPALCPPHLLSGTRSQAVVRTEGLIGTTGLDFGLC